MQKLGEVVERANSSLNIAIPVAILASLFIGFSYREGWEPIKKFVAIAAIALGLVGCAGSNISDVSLRHGETYHDRVAVVATSEAIRSPIEQKLKSEFDFSFVPYSKSHLAVLVTDSYRDGAIAIRVRIHFDGSEMHRLDIEEVIGEVDRTTAETLTALLVNDPTTLESIVELVRDALVVVDAKNKKHQQLAENR